MHSTTETQQMNTMPISKKGDNNAPIYRYKFMPNIVDLLTEFGKTHQYDPNKV